MFVDGNVYHTEKYKAKFQVFWAVFHHSFFLYHLTQLGRKKNAERYRGRGTENKITFFQRAFYLNYFSFFGNICFPYSQGNWMNQLLTKLVKKIQTSAAITNKTICRISKQCSIVNSYGKRFLNYYVKFLTCVRIHKFCRFMNLFNDSVFAPALPKFPETTRLQSEVRTPLCADSDYLETRSR